MATIFLFCYVSSAVLKALHVVSINSSQKPMRELLLHDTILQARKLKYRGVKKFAPNYITRKLVGCV